MEKKQFRLLAGYSLCGHKETKYGHEFNVRGSVHRNNILIYVWQDAALHSLFYLETALHVSGGTTTHHQERKQLSTASGICQTTTTATCR